MSNTTSQSKMLSLVPTNGTEFNLVAGQKVIFEVPPNLGLIKGRDSYLTLDICNTSSDNRRLALDNSAGSDSVISRVDIYSLQHGTHLETLQNYNQWTAISNQYLYEDKTNLQSLTGCGNKVYSQTDNGAGATKPVEMSSGLVEDTILSPIVELTGVHAYNFRRYTTPLKSGLLSWWQDERLCPVVAFGGLRIELTLENPKTALHNLFAQEKTTGTLVDISPDGANVGIACGNIPGGAPALTITSTADLLVDDSGLAVGNFIEIKNSTADITDAVISGLTKGGGADDKLYITFTSAASPTGVAAGSTGVSVKLRTDTRSAKIRPQFRVVSIAPPQEMLSRVSGGFQYEYATYDLLLSSLISSALRHEAEINSVANRALCIITAFANPAGYEEHTHSTYFSGQTPAELNLNSVQYFMDNKLQPVRSYNPGLNNDKVITFNEVVKALNTLSYEAKDLGNADGKNLEFYTNMFVIARQLAKRPFNYNLKDAEPQIRLGFSAARTDNIQVLNYVWSKKIVNVGANGDLDVVL